MVHGKLREALIASDPPPHVTKNTIIKRSLLQKNKPLQGMTQTECPPSACLPACLPFCLPACLPACLLACLLAYLLAY